LAAHKNARQPPWRMLAFFMRLLPALFRDEVEQLMHEKTCDLRLIFV
jgi:hypothetical protein